MALGFALYRAFCYIYFLAPICGFLDNVNVFHLGAIYALV